MSAFRTSIAAETSGRWSWAVFMYRYAVAQPMWRVAVGTDVRSIAVVRRGDVSGGCPSELPDAPAASWTHRGREELQVAGPGVVPDEVEGPGGGGDALVVADPPGSFLLARADRATARVEGSSAHP